MRTSPVFELNLLKRDWIEGVSGAAFFQRVQRCIERIESMNVLAAARGFLIAESEPLDYTAAFFASVHSGVPVILANPKWQQFEWVQLFEQVNPAIVFGDSGILKMTGSLKAKNPGVGMILIPTGGSSGKLKLAIHTWETLVVAGEGVWTFLENKPIHSCCVLPLYHVSGLMQLVRSFISGGRIALTHYKLLEAGQFPETAAEKLCLSLVPTQLQRMLAQPTIMNWLGNLRAIFLGGAPMSSDLRARLRKSGLPIVPTYGMTETAAMITALSTNDFISGNTSVGYPLAHATVQVIREDGSYCRPDERGRIQIRAHSLCQGYHGVPSDILQRGYLSTDEGYLDHKGYLHIVGRSDRIIISGGEKIDPLEVEAALLDSKMVDQALVIGWPDLEWGEQVIAFYVPADQADNVEDLRQYLKKNHVNYKIPRQIIRVPELPLTLQGKPDHTLIGKLLEKTL